MARAQRIAVAHYPHHIVQRGHNRNVVFASHGDHSAYLKTLAEFREKLALKVYGYCLMTNHVHLIVDPGDQPASISILMKHLAGRHTRRLNRLNRKTGSAWDGRFKCSLVDSDRYLLACTRYVDLNPVRAGIAARPEDYRWSSYRSRVGLDRCEWLDTDAAFLALAGSPEGRQHRYREFVEQGVAPHELELIRRAIQRNELTGSSEFRKQMEARTGLRALRRPRGRPKKENKSDPIFNRTLFPD